MRYIPYTDEEKQLANSVDLERFLQMRGEKLWTIVNNLDTKRRKEKRLK